MFAENEADYLISYYLNQADEVAKNEGKSTEGWSNENKINYYHDYKINKTINNVKEWWDKAYDSSSTLLHDIYKFSQLENEVKSEVIKNFYKEFVNELPANSKQIVLKGAFAALAASPGGKYAALAAGISSALTEAIFSGMDDEQKKSFEEIKNLFNTIYIKLDKRFDQQMDMLGGIKVSLHNNTQLVIKILSEMDDIKTILKGNNAFKEKIAYQTTELIKNMDAEAKKGYEHVNEVTDAWKKYQIEVEQSNSLEDIKQARENYYRTLTQVKRDAAEFTTILNTLSDAGKLMSYAVSFLGDAEFSAKIQTLVDSGISITSGLVMLFSPALLPAAASPLAPYVLIAGGILAIASMFQDSSQNPLVEQIKELREFISDAFQKISTQLDLLSKLNERVYINMLIKFNQLEVLTSNIGTSIQIVLDKVNVDLINVFKILSKAEINNLDIQYNNVKYKANLLAREYLETREYVESEFDKTIRNLFAFTVEHPILPSYARQIDFSNEENINLEILQYPSHFLLRFARDYMQHIHCFPPEELTICNPLELAKRSSFLIQFLTKTASLKIINFKVYYPEIIKLITYAENIQILSKSIQINETLYEYLFERYQMAKDNFYFTLDIGTKKQFDNLWHSPEVKSKIIAIFKNRRILNSPNFIAVVPKIFFGMPLDLKNHIFLKNFNSNIVTQNEFLYVFKLERKKEYLTRFVPLASSNIYYIYLNGSVREVPNSELEHIPCEEVYEKIILHCGAALFQLAADAASWNISNLEKILDNSFTNYVVDKLVPEFGMSSSDIQLFSQAYEKLYASLNRSPFGGSIINQLNIPNFVQSMVQSIIDEIVKFLPHSKKLSDFFEVGYIHTPTKGESSSQSIPSRDIGLKNFNDLRDDLIKTGAMLTRKIVTHASASSHAEIMTHMKSMKMILNLISLYNEIGYPHDLMAIVLKNSIVDIIGDNFKIFTIEDIIRNLNLGSDENLNKMCAYGMGNMVKNSFERIFHRFKDYIFVNIHEAQQMLSFRKLVSAVPFITHTIEQLRYFLLNYYQINYVSQTELIEKRILDFIQKHNFPHKIPGCILKSFPEEKSTIYLAVLDQLRLINYTSFDSIPNTYEAQNFLQSAIQDNRDTNVECSNEIKVQRLCSVLDLIIAIANTKDKIIHYIYYYINNDGALEITKDSSKLPKKPLIKLGYTGNGYLSIIVDSIKLDEVITRCLLTKVKDGNKFKFFGSRRSQYTTLLDEISKTWENIKAEKCPFEEGLDNISKLCEKLGKEHPISLAASECLLSLKAHKIDTEKFKNMKDNKLDHIALSK